MWHQFQIVLPLLFSDLVFVPATFPFLKLWSIRALMFGFARFSHSRVLLDLLRTGEVASVLGFNFLTICLGFRRDNLEYIS